MNKLYLKNRKMIALHSLSFTVLLVLSLSVTSCNKSEKQDRPNIIYIMTDDQRWDAFHFAGHIQLITPNLDQMASEGVVFTNVFHATPICEPSRASINSAVFHAGFLTGGKYFDYRIVDPVNPDDKHLFNWRDKFFNLCKEYNVLPAEACVQFGLSPAGVISISLNTSKPERVGQNVDLVRTRIPSEFWERMKSEKLIDGNYPYL